MDSDLSRGRAGVCSQCSTTELYPSAGAFWVNYFYTNSAFFFFELKILFKISYFLLDNIKFTNDEKRN